MIGKFTYEFPRRRPVALFHGHVVELHEVVDQRTLFIGHHVLQRAAGSLAIDIHSAQPSLAGIGPDRRLRAVDPLIVFARAAVAKRDIAADARSEEHTSELQSLMRISYAVFCLKKKNKKNNMKDQTCVHQTNEPISTS